MADPLESQKVYSHEELFGSDDEQKVYSHKELFGVADIQPERGFFGDTASHLARGVVSLGETTARAAETITGSDTAKRVGNYLRDLPDDTAILQPDQSEVAGEGAIKKGWVSAVESTPESLAILPAAIAGAKTGALVGTAVEPGLGTAIGGVAGGIIGSGAALLTLFGAGQYGKQKDYVKTRLTKERPDLKQEEIETIAHENALTHAYAEVGGEGAGDLAAYIIFSRIPGGKAAYKGGKAVLKELVNPNAIKAISKGLLKDAPFEVGSEVLTSYFQNEADIKAGVSDQSTLQSMGDAIIPALFLSTGMGVAIGGRAAWQRKNAYKGINEGTPEERAAYVRDVATTLAESTDTEVATVWAEKAMTYVEAGDAIPLDSDVADLAANSPEPPAEADPILQSIEKVFADTSSSTADTRATEQPSTVENAISNDELLNDLIDNQQDYQEQVDVTTRRRKFEALKGTPEDSTTPTKEVDLTPDEVDLTPEDIKPGVEKIIQQLNEKDNAGKIYDGVGNHSQVVGGYASTAPEWLKYKYLKKYDKKHGTTYVKKISEQSVRVVLANVKAGKKLTPKQNKVYEYVKIVAKDLQENNPELVAATKIDSLQEEGFEFDKPVKIPVGNLSPGDEVVIEKNGIPDRLTHKGFDEENNAILEDGVTLHVDPFEQIEVIAQKQESKITEQEKQNFGDLLSRMSEGTAEDVDKIESEITPFFEQNKHLEPYRTVVESAIKNRRKELSDTAKTIDVPDNIRQDSVQPDSDINTEQGRKVAKKTEAEIKETNEGKLQEAEEGTPNLALTEEESSFLDSLSKSKHRIIPNEKNKPIYDSLVEKGLAETDGKSYAISRQEPQTKALGQVGQDDDGRHDGSDGVLQAGTDADEKGSAEGGEVAAKGQKTAAFNAENSQNATETAVRGDEVALNSEKVKPKMSKPADKKSQLDEQINEEITPPIAKQPVKPGVVEAGKLDKSADQYGGVSQGVSVKKKDTFTVQRLNKETDKFEEHAFVRGETVKAWIAKGNYLTGKITGISHAKKEVKVNSQWFEFGRTYKTEQPVQKKKAVQKLSETLSKVNKKNEPEGGFTQSDKVTPDKVEGSASKQDASESNGAPVGNNTSEFSPSYDIISEGGNTYEIPTDKNTVDRDGNKSTAVSEPVQTTLLSPQGKSVKGGTKTKAKLLEAHPVKIGSFKFDLEQIESVEDVAQVLFPLGKRAQETFMALVLDANNQPIAILQHTVGGPVSNQVFLTQLLGSIHNLKGASSVWVAHNHPSSNTEESPQDINLTKKIQNAINGTGIELRGHLIMTPAGKVAALDSDGVQRRQFTVEKQGKATRSVKVTERRLKGEEPELLSTETINDNIAARSAAQEYSNGQNGILLLDSQHRPIKFIPIPLADMKSLRSGSGRTAAKLYRLLDKKNNAIAAILNFSGDSDSHLDAATNMVKFGNATGLKILDSFFGGKSKNNTQSVAQTVGDVFHSESKTPIKNAAKVIQELIKAVGRGTVNRLTRKGLLNVVTIAQAEKVLAGLGVDPKFSKEHGGIKSDKTPDALRLIGGGANGIIIPKSVIDKVVDGKHQGKLNPSDLQEIGNGIFDPVAILASKTHPQDSVIVVTEVINAKGERTIVPVKVVKKRGRNVVTSIYGKKQPEWFDAQIKGGRLLYLNEEKASKGSMTTQRLHLPTLNKNRRSVRGFPFGSEERILTEKDIVKPDIKYSADGSRMEGFTATDTDGQTKSWIVEGNVAGGDAYKLLLHEVSSHLMLEGKFKGKEWDAIINTFNHPENKNTATGKAIREARAMVPADTKPEHLNSELLAYYIGSTAGRTQSLYRRIMSYIKERLVEIGFSARMFTPADIEAIAKRSLSRIYDPNVKGESKINQFAQNTRMSVKAAGRKIANMPAFKKWFKDSKVVDEEGNPLVVYHGSYKENISAFDPSKAGDVQTSDWGEGTYFTPSKYGADYYKTEAVKRTDRESGRLYEEYENAAKKLGTSPMSSGIDLGRDSEGYERLETYRKAWQDHDESLESGDKGKTYATYLNIKNPKIYTYSGMTDPSLAERAKDQGYDGIFIVREDGSIDEIVAFKPNQIKSIHNTKWDGNNTDIMKSMSRTKPQKYLDAAKKITDTANFKRWFGRSKIKSNGQPHILYHGTSDPQFLQDKDYPWVFDTDRKVNKGSSPLAGLGIFLGNDTIAGAHSVGTPGTIHPFFVKIENPLVMTSAELEAKIRDVDSAKAFRKRAMELGGYDGIIIKDRGQVIAFESNQLKSVSENTGAFGSTDSDVRYSIGSSLSDIADRYRDVMKDEKYRPIADSGFLSKLFSSPEYTFRKAEAAWRVFQVQEGRMDEKIQLENEIFNTVIKEDGTKTGFLQTLSQGKKKFSAAYKKANNYILKVDKSGKTFTLKKEDPWMVVSPDGEIIGYGETKTLGRELAKEANNVFKLKNKGVKRNANDYTIEEAEKWSVVDKDGNTMKTFDSDKEASVAMMDYEGKELASKGFNKKSVEYVREYREMTNRAFDLMIDDIRGIIAQAKELGLDEPTVSIVDETKRWAVYQSGKKIAIFGTKQDARAVGGEGKTIKEQKDDEIRKELKLSELIAVMSDLRGFYFARQRSHGSYILRAEKDGEKVMKKFDFYMVGDKQIDAVTNKEVKRAPVAWMKKAFNFSSTFIPGSLAHEMIRLKREGYTIAPVEKDTAMPESIFESSKLVASMSALLDEAKNKAEKKGIDKKAVQEANKILTGMLSDIVKQRGYMSSRIKRTSDYWTGFEEDMLLSGTQYGRGLAAGIAKKKAAQKFISVVTGRDISYEKWQEDHPDQDYGKYLEFIEKRKLDPTKQPVLYADTMNFIKEMLRNEERVDRVFGTLKGIAVVKFLGFRVSSAAVNATNMVQAVPAVISAATGGKITDALIEVGKSAKTYYNFKRGKNISASDRTVLLEIINRGWDEAQFNKESVEVLQGKLGRGWNELTEFSMKMFGAVEKVNRATTILSAYNQFKVSHSDMTHEEMLLAARQASNDAHGLYGKATRPVWTRGAWNPLQLAFVFAKFSQNYSMKMLEMGLKGDTKQAAYMLLSPAILAGGGASLATPVIMALAGALGIGGDDPEEEFYKWAEESFGSGSFARHGLAGLAGVNLKGSIQMNNPMPTTLSEIFGAPGAIFTDMAKGAKHIKDGEYYKGAESILPTGIGAAIKSVREGSEGITTGSYSPVYYGNEPLKADGLDTTLRFLGFNPARISGIREMQWHEKVVKRKYQERRNEINSKIKRYFVYKKGNLPEIYKEIQRYNELVRGSGRRDISLINPRKQFKTIVKRAKRASKTERLRTL